MRRLMKLRRMSADEIRVRCGDVLRRQQDRRAWRRAHGRATLTQGVDVLGGASRLVPGATGSELERLRRASPEIHECIAKRSAIAATIILSRTRRMLGHEFDLCGAIDWHRDPRTEYCWSRTFYGDLPLYDLPPGVDVKYVWELGRHQYLADLGRDWLLRGERRSAERVCEVLLDWIETNPLYEGIHWTSGLEVAMRAISWIWSLAALAKWDGWSSVDRDRLASSLADHASYLEHHFSFYSSPFNHLVGEATGLYLISHVLDGNPDAERWRRRSRAVLEEHGPRQFYGDGFCVEQATGYHFYTLGFLSLALTAARRAGEPMTGLQEAVQRAYRAGAIFRQPDGRWPAIGDVDSARSIPVPTEDFWNFDSLCALGAALFDDPTIKTSDRDPGEELFWLLGAEGVRRWRSLTEQPLRRVLLKDSGYAVAGDGRDWLLFDAGPVAGGLHADATPSVAHGHADTLQVLYVKDGATALVDRGMPFYGGGRRDWVDHFRSAAAHNTIEVDGAGPVKLAGRLAWSHATTAPALTADLSDTAWLVAGRAVWGGGTVVIERHLLAIPRRGLWVADLIATDRPRMVRWYWHSPNRVADDGSAAQGRLRFRSDNLVITAQATSEPLCAEVIEADEASPEAWQCPGYGEQQRGFTLRLTATARGRLLVVTSIGSGVMPFALKCGGLQLRAGLSEDMNEMSAFALEGAEWKIEASSDVDDEITGSRFTDAGDLNRDVGGIVS